MPTTFITKKPIDDLSTLSSGFGSRVPPKPKASSKHKGDDFAVYKVPVYSAHDAKVIYKGYNANGWGNFIVLRDPATGAGTLYGHLNSFSKITDPNTGLERDIAVGDQISGGKQIAVSGNSGPTGTPYHLHFEVFGSDAIGKMQRPDGTYRTPNPKDVRENPRDHLSAAFPTEFPTDVLSGPNAIDVIGDFRENTLIGNSRPNNMIGKEGFDTYYVNFGDTISDVDGNGKIVISNEANQQSTLLEGNASPYLDSLGNILPNKWSLNGFDLTRSDNNLIITKAGQDPNSSNVGKITVADFPFSKDRAFGIDLGKIRDGLSDNIRVTVPYRITTNIYPSADKRGRFISFLSEDSDLKVKVFDTNGFVTSEQFVYKYAFTQGQSTMLPSGNIALIYGANDETYDNRRFVKGVSSGCLAVIDPYGKLISNRKLDEVVSTNGNEWNNLYICFPSSIGTKLQDDGTHKNSVCFTRGGGVSNYCAHLDDAGNAISSLGFVDYSSLSLYGGASSGGDVVELPSGESVQSDRYGFSIISKRSRDITAAEAVSNQLISSGIHNTNPALSAQMITAGENAELRVLPSPNQIIGITGLQNDGVTIDLSSVETSKSDISSKMCTVSQSEYSFEDLIRGAAKNCVSESSNNRKLQSGNITDDDYTYGDDDYSAQNSTIPTSFDNPAQFVVAPLPQNQLLVFAGISKQDLQKDFDRYFSLEPLAVETSNPSQEPTIKTSNPTGLPSQNPSGLPSKNPSATPSHHPTAGELIMPTGNPTGIPSGIPTGIPSGQPSSQPTGIPSRTPFADPSAIPSYRPQAIPSFRPSGNPSNQPSQEPTIKTSNPTGLPSQNPSGLPSKNPSGLPSQNPSSNPSHHPTAGDLIMPTNDPTGIPTGIPSGQPSSQPTGIPSRTPFANPSAIPSYRPQAIPSFKPSGNPSNQPSQEPTQEKKQPSLRPSLNSENPTEIPTEEIRSSKPTNFPISAPPIPAPSFNTNQPSLLPSNQVGGRSGNNFSNLGPKETAGVAAAGLVVGGILIKAVVEGVRFVDRFLRGDKKAVSTDEKVGDVELEGRSSDDTVVVNQEVYQLGAEESELRKSNRVDSPKSSPKTPKYQQLAFRDNENSIQI